MQNSNEDINEAPAFLLKAEPPYMVLINDNMQGKDLRCSCGTVYTWLDPNNSLLIDMKKDPIISEFLMRRYKYDTSRDNTDCNRSNEINEYDYRRRSPSYHSHSRHRDYYNSPRHSRSRYSESRSPSPYYEYRHSYHRRHRRSSRSRSRSHSSHMRWSYYESPPLQVPPIIMQQQQPPIQALPSVQIQQQQEQQQQQVGSRQKPLELSELENKYKGRTMEEVGEETLVNEVLEYNKRNGLTTNINIIREKVHGEMEKNRVLLRIEKILEYCKKCSLSKIQSLYEETYGEKIDSTRFLGYKKLGKCLQIYGFTLKPIPDDTIVFPTYRSWF